MPFTPSHAVVALPFVRTPLVPAAIAIGAMTPDLPLFLRSTPLTYQATHTNVLLSTVIALGLLALWYAVLRPAVRELSPDALARRLPAEWDGPPAFGRTGGERGRVRASSSRCSSRSLSFSACSRTSRGMPSRTRTAGGCG